MTNVTAVPGTEWADELSRLHGSSDGKKRRRYGRLLTLLVLMVAVVVVILTLA